MTNLIEDTWHMLLIWVISLSHAGCNSLKLNIFLKQLYKYFEEISEKKLKNVEQKCSGL